MKADQLRELYLSFFEGKGHKIISGASLIPENDPTVLFTTAGMHPLVPYLLGEPHPSGKRLCDCQKCVRTGDIDEVGDPHHLTFFEMLGNWSLGDYFKEEAISWSFEFLTSKDYLAFDVDRLSVTVFAGNASCPRDDESIGIWKKLGIPGERIHALPETDNWWGLGGKNAPCGPDTEMFIDTGKAACGTGCRPGCRCGKYIEIWNDVFMQFESNPGQPLSRLKQHNVDTGMGVERTIAMLQGRKSVYETELFAPTISVIAGLCGRPMDADADTGKAFRVVSDHVRSSVFILGDHKGIVPGNVGQGYVLRRLIRRAVRFAKNLGLKGGFTRPIAESFIEGYKRLYPELEQKAGRIVEELGREEERFEATLARGMQELGKVLENITAHGGKGLSGRVAFRLYDTYGFPLEFTEEICREQGLTVDREEYEKSFEKHRELARKDAGSFKGGLADSSEATTRLHTATHLLHKSLQTVLGDHVKQKGSNITPERLRFDFSHNDKMTPEQLAKVEELVNEAIRRDLPVSFEVLTLDQAKQSGAMALFEGKYGEQVKVYSMGDVSKEVCGGPHVAKTGELGRFKIVKESASSAGVRRIKAILEAV